MKAIIILAIILMALLSYMSLAQTYSDITYDAGTTIDVGSGADICATNIYINGTYSGGGTICSGPLPVTLSSFMHSVDKNNVRLMWVTEIELNNSGFDIERAIITQNGPGEWKKVGFVQGSGTTSQPKGYIYEDKKIQTGKYNYRLKQIDYSGNFEYFGLNNDVDVAPPFSFSVSQNYPNPSNPKSKIDYQLPMDSRVIIRIYNLLGQEVAALVDEIKQAGYHTAEFDGSNLASGVYFYRLEAGDFKKIMKLVLVK